MSRSPLPLLLIGFGMFSATAAAEPAPIAAEAAMEKYVSVFSVDPDCRRNVEPDEITVCGRRDADRYRLPLVIPTPGAPDPGNARAERDYLVRTISPCEERGPFLIGCGSVGVSVGMAFDGRVTRYRQLAP
jgi:hypothetical protein